VLRGAAKKQHLVGNFSDLTCPDQPHLIQPSTSTVPSWCRTVSGPPKSMREIGDTGVTSRRKLRDVFTYKVGYAAQSILCISYQ